MKTNKMTAVAAAVLLAVTLAGGEALARGGNGGGGGGRGNGQCNLNRTQTQSQAQVRTRTPADSSLTRPADSQRRDGTFLSTGVTANGSTTRPGYGKGLQDGSGLNTTPAPPVASE
jgi:hypothetical protein